MTQERRTGWCTPLASALLALLVSTGASRASDSETEVILTGYLFASGLEGRASTTPALPPANLDLSFSDVLEDLDFGFMGAVEVRRGRWGFLSDLMYTKVSPSATLPGPLSLTGVLEQKSWIVQGNVLYRVVEDEGVAVDLGAGLRYWSVDNVGSLNPGSLGFSHNESWVDPVVVARMTAQIDGPWSVTLAGDIGGGGSDLTWQLLGTLNYQKSERVTFRVGYRALSVDYDSGGFVYDVTMQGPVIGVSMRF